MTVWVLGDQLTRAVGPLSRAEGDERVLMIEARDFARRHAYHPHKLVLVFSAMRHFRDDLRDAGYDVSYHRSDTFDDALNDYFESVPNDSLTVMKPASYGAGDRFTDLVEGHGGSLEIAANETFLCSEGRFEEFADGRDTFDHESFYRMMRRETSYLMDGDDPVGGEWNLDEQNREFPGDEYDAPGVPNFEPDDLTEDVIESVRERGYSHHIERLMVLSNFALTYGVRPQALNEWFHAAYVDAYHWVTTPNVIEMGSYGSGVFATKLYASSANYIGGMSDHCADCAYARTKTEGENACPFNALYWGFLGRDEERLGANHRMGLVYSHWEDKDAAEREAIAERANDIRDLAAEGDL